MSGGVGPTSDIVLPKEEQDQEPNPINPIPSQDRQSLLTFRQLNALAVVTVFSATGMVGIEDCAFAIFSFFYIYFLSKAAFPALTPRAEPPVFGKSRLLGVYVAIGALIGLFLPIGYIFEGIYEGDKEGIKAAAPHVFLLSAQIFMEGMTFSHRFSLPIRAFVPVFYNTKRLFTIAEWLKTEIGKAEEEHGSTMRLHVGQGLAVANLVFWSFNLFGFLLPVYFPKAFQKYYSPKVKD
ncbi:uncharacterized protein LOC131230597 [Magnolia sinica]|uniref:uncharacterized protein LOC131230597 n=1 Tax=Magnolia sinica TaxID=86752 RepID=UPI0026582FAA|nr:uncharacterized protein LOC131230597 [Magnolia sinica]